MKAILATFVAGLLACSAWATDMTFHYSPYPPLNFEENGQVVGIGADQVSEIMKRTGLSHDMIAMKWSRAIALAENTPAACVITVHTDDRDARFKWVEPLMTQETMLVGLSTTTKPASLEEALKGRIGSWNSDSSVDLLKALGVTEIDLAPTMETTLQKLKGGRIDYVPLNSTAIAELKAQGFDLAPMVSIATSITGIACSLDTPDETMQTLQVALDTLITDGTQQEILARYQ